MFLPNIIGSFYIAFAFNHFEEALRNNFVSVLNYRREYYHDLKQYLDQVGERIVVGARRDLALIIKSVDAPEAEELYEKAQRRERELQEKVDGIKMKYKDLFQNLVGVIEASDHVKLSRLIDNEIRDWTRRAIDSRTEYDRSGAFLDELLQDYVEQVKRIIQDGRENDAAVSRLVSLVAGRRLVHETTMKRILVSVVGFSGRFSFADEAWDRALLKTETFLLKASI